MLYFHVRADTQDLIAPASLTEQVSTHRAEQWLAVLLNTIRANLGVVQQMARVAYISGHLFDRSLECVRLDQLIETVEGHSARGTVPNLDRVGVRDLLFLLL